MIKQLLVVHLLFICVIATDMTEKPTDYSFTDYFEFNSTFEPSPVDITISCVYFILSIVGIAANLVVFFVIIAGKEIGKFKYVYTIGWSSFLIITFISKHKTFISISFRISDLICSLKYQNQITDKFLLRLINLSSVDITSNKTKLLIYLRLLVKYQL